VIALDLAAADGKIYGRAHRFKQDPMQTALAKVVVELDATYQAYRLAFRQLPAFLADEYVVKAWKA